MIAHTPTVGTGSSVSPRVTADVPAAVDLTLHGRHLDGTVNGEATHLDLGERSHDMAVHGTFAGAALDARVGYAYNYRSRIAEFPIGLTARLTGSFADQKADLRFGYDLRPSHRFQAGEITGNVAGRTLRATVTVTPPSTKSKAISGSWGSADIDLLASVAVD